MIKTSLGLLESLQQTLQILRNFQKCLGTFVWPLKQFWKIFRNLQKCGLKCKESLQKRYYQYVL